MNTIKNETTSFGLLSAFILAGVILACVPPANSSNLTSDNSGLAALTAYVANANVASVSVSAPVKARTCSNERKSAADRVEGKTAPATPNSPKSPAV